jgi:hypothetical protein
VTAERIAIGATPPAPQSTKHTAEHAWTIAAEAAQSVEALRREAPR